ncbi:Hypothetical protein RBTH_08999 [Bacillus thuringiensis serovar israelensis ATCC 35646]|nr:Hypothetical protein RBTH_08999 [Bacillus thuringiensis serovar israelensis ATCC 35646]
MVFKRCSVEGQAMQFQEYMDRTFPGVTLVPYLYSQWGNHLYFDFWKR